jgi:hypothetical protein
MLFLVHVSVPNNKDVKFSYDIDVVRIKMPKTILASSYLQKLQTQMAP